VAVVATAAVVAAVATAAAVVVAAVEVATAAVAVVAVGAEAAADLAPLATLVGKDWVVELVHALRASERSIRGAWPGTVGEARGRILARLRRRLDVHLLDDLAKVAILAARRDWQHVTQPDPEL
jgi:hypothetical protein